MTKRTKRLKVVATEIANCEKCGLCKTRTNTVPGKGASKAAIMLIGEAPGEQEDLSGKPFVGKSGKLLDHLLKQAKLARADVFITNSVKCRPPNNRKPTALEQVMCSGYLERQVKIIDPKIIVTIGGPALEAVLHEPVRITEARGTPCETLNFELGKRWGTQEGVCRTIVPTLHPSYLFRNPSQAALVVKDLRLAKKLSLQ